MKRLRISLLISIGLLAVVAAGAWAQGSGQVVGRIVDDQGKGIEGVTVVVASASLAEVTDGRGQFHLGGLAAGTYDLTLTLGARSTVITGVEVKGGETTEITETVDWDVNFAETITVMSASRRRERIVEAPAAVTRVTEEDIQLQAAQGQVPKLLEYTPGAEITQSGLYDFNLNTRGFNSSLNRRVPTLIDGRDPSIPFLMSQDWPSMSAMEDLATAELVRGPSSALYGTNAYNGVLNLTTKQPRFSQGGTLRLTGGNLATLRVDARAAAQLAENSYLKVMGSYVKSEDFYQSRCAPGVGSCPSSSPLPEYDGLPIEAAPVATDEDKILVGNLRFDQYLRGGLDAFTIEAGYSSVEGPPVQTGIGRVQVLESKRPWARLNYSSERFNFLAYYNKRDAPEQLALGSGGNLYLESDVWAVELQGNLPFAGSKGQLVGGASYRDENIDTRGTLTFTDVEGDRTAVFGQLEYSFTDKLKAVAAARWDDSSLHDSEVSPKGALVFSPTPSQTFRLTYNEAFQSPNYSEFFLYAPTAINTPAGPITAIDLSAIEAGLCAPFGVACGFDDPVRVRALGNDALEVETISTWEVGYTAIAGSKLFLTLDYYRSELENFVTDLIANPFGSVNPQFGTYQAPANHPAPELLYATLQGALGPLYAFLSNGSGGEAIFALASYTNAGRAETQGVDLGINWYIDDRWTYNFSYSWFDFDLKESAVGDQVEPNAPEHSFRTGIAYADDSWTGSLNFRWVDDFAWAAGAFVGPVESYSTVDLALAYRLADHWSVGINVANLLDDEHYESFGGDVLGIRALGNLGYSW